MRSRLKVLTLIVAALAVASFAATVHAGLLAYWNFDDGGAVAADASGNRAWGTIQGATSAAGKYGRALSFDGNDQVLIANVASQLGSIDGQATIAFWQYGAPSQPRSDSIFSAQNSGGGRVLQSHLPWSNGRVYWDAGNSYERIDKPASAAQYRGEWRHWAFTKDVAAGSGVSTGEMKVYYQGSEWHSGDGKTLSMAGIERMAIGSNYYGGYYQGVIDEFAVWDEVLSPTAINDLANATQAMTINAPMVNTTLTNTGGTVSPGGDGVVGTITIVSPQNSATGGTAAQSSTRSGGGGNEAKFAIDGNTDGDFWQGSVTHTNTENQPWWYVDLGTLKPIDSVALYNRTDCCGDRLTNFRISVFDDATLTNEVWGDDFYASGYPNPSMSVALPDGVVGQYVQVQLKNNSVVLSLAEVEVVTLDGPADFIQAGDGTLAIDVDFSTLTSDLLAAAGGMQLGGTLQVNLLGTPQPGHFHILDWSTTLSGQFDTLNLPALPSNLDWDTSKLYSTGTLSVVPEPATMFIWAVLTFCASMGAGRWGRRRQLGGSGGGSMRNRASARIRQPWTPEQRRAIANIIERGRVCPPRSDWADADAPW